MLGSVVPRLAHSAFLFTEPFLLQRVLKYMADSRGPLSHEISYGLVGAYAIVHVGKAVCTLPRQHTLRSSKYTDFCCQFR